MCFAQSMQHDPSIAGKMFNPTTGRAETIDSLLQGPDKDIWIAPIYDYSCRYAN
jgi:hypothetical protein